MEVALDRRKGIVRTTLRAKEVRGYCWKEEVTPEGIQNIRVLWPKCSMFPSAHWRELSLDIHMNGSLSGGGPKAMGWPASLCSPGYF